MRRLVETLELASSTHSQRTCDRQLRLFKALYGVAEKYVEVKFRAGGQGMSWAVAQQQHADSFAGATSGFGVGTVDPGRVVTDTPGHMPLQGGIGGGGMGLVDELGGNLGLQNAFGDGDVEMDPEGAQLWEWFTKNQSIMRMLEDT